MKLKQIALLVCIVFVIMAILGIITTINWIIQEVNFVNKISYIQQFLYIIQETIVAYFFYLFYKKIK